MSSGRENGPGGVALPPAWIGGSSPRPMVVGVVPRYGAIDVKLGPLAADALLRGALHELGGDSRVWSRWAWMAPPGRSSPARRVVDGEPHGVPHDRVSPSRVVSTIGRARRSTDGR